MQKIKQNKMCRTAGIILTLLVHTLMKYAFSIYFDMKFSLFHCELLVCFIDL